jgi:hypothetical protein
LTIGKNNFFPVKINTTHSSPSGKISFQINPKLLSRFVPPFCFTTNKTRMTKQPKKWKMAILIWIAIYPTVTIVAVLFGNHFEKINLLPLRTLVCSINTTPAYRLKLGK